MPYAKHWSTMKTLIQKKSYKMPRRHTQIG